MSTNETPVAYRNPFNGQIESMPVAMVSAYVPYGTDLNLEEAARVAAIRDDEAATNLLFSIILDQHDTEYQRVITVPEGYDETTAQALTLAR